jgi:SpoVK/Ycf46/Vps4 family AAA+-type ATPase
MFVENLGEIKFDDNAFDYLVLDPKRKRIAKSLVVNSKDSFGDIITGKSGGCIFLLHGPPGTRKTLTCEAISELLHQPLYSITVGELGTTPETLELKLTRILEMTKSWNAVILIDEADIFLEKRAENDVQRNAMVGFFLRLLERHTGVMFLTTNRAEQLDEAFRSRISVIFKYPKLDFVTRFQIWKNLLRASTCDLPEEDVALLASREINGRQIKNAIRMAQSLALTDNVPISKQYLDDVIELMDLSVLQEDMINQVA